MRVLLDTNVLIAAFIARGACSELFEHCVCRHTLVSSPVLLEELGAALIRQLGFTRRDGSAVVSLVRTRTELVEAPELEIPACRDPDDDRVLAAAVACGCDCIVTGENDLLVLESLGGIPIVTPAQFWKIETP